MSRALKTCVGDVWLRPRMNSQYLRTAHGPDRLPRISFGTYDGSVIGRVYELVARNNDGDRRPDIADGAPTRIDVAIIDARQQDRRARSRGCRGGPSELRPTVTPLAIAKTLTCKGGDSWLKPLTAHAYRS